MEKNENLTKKNQNKSLAFETLPREINQHIFNFFTAPEDLAIARLINKAANALTEKPLKKLAQRTIKILSDKNKIKELPIDKIENCISLLINLGYKFDAYRLLQSIYAEEYKQTKKRFILAPTKEEFQAFFILKGMYGDDFEMRQSNCGVFIHNEDGNHDMHRLLDLENLMRTKFRLAGYINAEFIFNIADITSCDPVTRVFTLGTLYVIKTLIEKYSDNLLVKEELELVNQYFALCLKNYDNSISFKEFSKNVTSPEPLDGKTMEDKYHAYDTQLSSGKNNIAFRKDDKQVYLGLFSLADIIATLDRFHNETSDAINFANEWLEKNGDLFKTDNNNQNRKCVIL